MTLDFAFTEHDTPELRRRIEGDLSTIATRVSAADPHLRALVLTGGFSRGEGTAIAGSPANDYDLVAVRDRPGRGPYASLHASLSEEIGLEVDLLPIWRRRLARVAPKLFWLDLQLGGRVIAGDEDALRAMPPLHVRDLRWHEVPRLLGNRAAGMLLSLPVPNARPAAFQRDLQATKAVLAAMDATLIDQRTYAPRLRERLSLARGHPDHATFALAVEWKLSPSTRLPADWWRVARDVLLRAVDATGARRAGDGLGEHALHLLKAHRLAINPSQAVRRRAWTLLATSTWPEGPIGVSWPREKRAFFAARALTLQ